MSNNKKDAPADPKRPHATLDLKATDLTPPSERPKVDDPQATTPKPEGAAGAEAKSDDKPAAATGKPGTGKSEAPTTKPVAARRGGLVSHLLAGIAGGIFAIALAEWAAPRLGISTPTLTLQTRTTELQDRIGRIEAAAVDGETAGKVKAAEDRIAGLEGKTETLASEQAQFARDTSAALEKLATNTLSAETSSRLAAMDERLAEITKAAEDGKGGTAGQMTAMTGKLGELRSEIGKTIDDLRRSLPQDVEPRLARLDAQAEAAKSGITRVDGDINGIRTDAARLAQRIETQKADSDRAAATLVVLQEEAARLASGFNEVKSTVASQVRGGVGEAITPVAQKLSALEEDLQNVVKSEEDRRANAERIVISLELANLKRMIDSGQNYASGLAEVRKAAGDKLNLDMLEHFKDTGVPTVAELQRSFRPVANAIVDAAATPADGGVIDKLMAGAKSVVRVRNLNPAPGDKGAEAIAARMQTALAEGHLGEVLSNAEDLPAAATAPVQTWLANVKARHAVDRAIAQIEDQLKSSLTKASVGSEAAPAPATHAPDPGAYDAPILPSEGRLPAPGSVRPNPAAPASPENVQP